MNLSIINLKQKKLIIELRSIFEKNKIYSKLEENNKKILKADFWQDKVYSQKIIKEKKLQEELLNSYKSSVKDLLELTELNQLARQENNEIIIKETIDNIRKLIIFLI